MRTKDGSISTYLAVDATRYAGHADGMKAGGEDGVGPQRVLWLLDAVKDRSGNTVRYLYQVLTHTGSVPEGGEGKEVLVDRIEYTSNRGSGIPDDVVKPYRQVRFVYEEGTRPDVEFAYSSGVKFLRTRRLAAVVMQAPAGEGAATQPVWKYEFAYQPQPSLSSGRSRLASVRRCATDASGATVAGGCTMPKRFEWTAGTPTPTFTSQNLGPVVFEANPAMLPGTGVMDVDADGVDDLMVQGLVQSTTHKGSQVWRGVRYANGEVAPLAQIHPNPIPFFGGVLHSSSVVDFDGNGTGELWTIVAEPIPGASTGYTCHERLLTWTGSAFDYAAAPALPSYYCGPRRKAAQTRFLDLDGDGRPDMLMAKDVPNPFQPGDEDSYVLGKWDAYLNTGTDFKFLAPTGVQAGCPTHIVDTDGDGLSELITGFVLLSPGKYPDACVADLLPDRVQRVEKREGADAITVDNQLLASSPWPAATFKAGVNGESVAQDEVYWGDFNGDGLSDALVKSPAPLPLRVRWNIGHGFTPPIPVSGLTLTGKDDVRILDANHDGRADVFVLPRPDPANPYNPWDSLVKLHLSDGYGAFVATPVPGGLDRGGWVDKGGDFNLDDNGDGTVTDAELANDPGFTLSNFGDFNGDGFTDWAAIKTIPLNTVPATFSHELWLYTQKPVLADRLAAVYDAASEPALTVRYDTRWADKSEPLPMAPCQYPIRCVRSGIPVVREVSERVSDAADPARKWQRYQYSYAFYRADAQEGALGFQYFWVFDPLRQVETKYEFDPAPLTNPATPGRRYYNTQPRSVTTTVPMFSAAQLAQAQKPTAVAGRVQRWQALSHEVRLLNGGRSWAMFPQETSRREWEQTVFIDAPLTLPSNTGMDRIYGIKEPATVLSRVDSVSQFDDFGNPTFVETVVQGGATTTVDSPYDNDPVNWLSVRRETTVRAQEANPTLPARQRHTAFTYTQEGYLHTIEREPDAADPTLRLTTTFGYNAYGLVTNVSETGTNSQGKLETRTTHFARDPWAPGQPAEEVFLSQTWLDHALPFSSWVAIHPAYGVPVATQDALGVRRWAQYDVHGRPIRSGGDGIATGTLGYAGRPDAAGGYSGAILTRQLLGANGLSVRTATHVTDGLGRTLTQSGQGFDGTVAQVRLQYDIYGRVQAVSRPYTGTPSADTVYEHDALGRTTAVHRPDGTTSTSTYTYFTVNGFDALGNHSQSIHDVNGRPVESIEYLKNANGTTTPLSTTYRYGAFGWLEESRDPQGHLSTWDYDRLGRLHKESLPGTGSSAVLYDSFGAVRHVDRADGTSELSYDALGRLLQRTDRDASGATQFQASLDWDTAAHGLGQLAGTTAQNGPAPLAETVTTAYAYDPYGRLTQHATTVDDRTYVFGAEYDDQGRAVAQSYPAIGADPHQPSFKTCYGYNGTGYLAKIGRIDPTVPCMPDVAPLWEVQARTLDGALSRGLYGNGMLTERRYDPLMGRLQKIATRPNADPLSAPLFQLDYDYYANGLVKTIGDPVSKRTQGYTYDSLLRLTQWDLTVNEAVRSTGYEYDELGNLTQISRSQTPLGQPAVPLKPIQRNRYDQPGKPHAISQRDDLLSGDTYAYAYDDLGRQTQSTRNGLKHRSIDYVQGGLLPRRLTTGEGQWTYAYDALGQRVKKSGADGTTVSIGPFERRERGGEIKHVLQLAGTDGPVAQAVFDGTNPMPQFSYAFTDALGSSGVQVDSSGKIERMFYEPFGQRIESDGTRHADTFTDPLAELTRGFTGHRMEFYGKDNDLIDMRGRLYDPTAGRFLAPDPFVTSGQGANRYSYVNNSPLNFTDPSGYQICTTTAYSKNPDGTGGTAAIVDENCGQGSASSPAEAHSSATAHSSIDMGGGASNSVDTQGVDNLGGPAGANVGGPKPGGKKNNAPQSGEPGAVDAVLDAQIQIGRLHLLEGWQDAQKPSSYDPRCGSAPLIMDEKECQVELDFFDRACDIAASSASKEPSTGGCPGSTWDEKSVALVALALAGGISEMKPGRVRTEPVRMAKPSVMQTAGSLGYAKSRPLPKHGNYGVTHGANPNGSRTNCFGLSCAGAERIRSGKPVQTNQEPGEIMNVKDGREFILKNYGIDSPLIPIAGAKEAVELVRNAGNGAMAVYTEGMGKAIAGHSTLMVNDNGIIRFYDFQLEQQATVLGAAETAAIGAKAEANGMRLFPWFRLHFLTPAE